jgi:hypothetical protein
MVFHSYRPAPIYEGTATAEQKIIVEFVLLSGRFTTTEPSGRGTLDGEDDNGVVRGSKDVTTESIAIGLPPHWIALRLAIVSIIVMLIMYTLTYRVPLGADIVPSGLVGLKICVVRHLREKLECRSL